MNAVTKTEKPKPTVEFRDQWTRQESEIATALPPHMPVERFMRVVLTAVNGNPDLLAADRRSLFESAMRAAQDGLLPDGRDGALVIYNTKTEIDGRKEWIKKVQWMPMVGGILKKVRNSGELQTISAYVAYENDHFEYSLGDEESITHRPCLDDDRGRPRLVYAIAKTKDGGIYREIMTFKEIEKVRGVSRAKDNGPWKDWWDEMAKKTVIRRLAKRLPMSSDLDDLIRRDDDLYDFQGKRADMDGMHKSLAGPTVTERLKAAQNGAESVEDKREGFSSDFIEHEAENASTTPNSDDSTLSSQAVSDDAGDPPPSPAELDGDGESSSPSSPSEEEPAMKPVAEEDRERLIECARKMMGITQDDLTPNERFDNVNAVKAGWVDAMPEARDKIGAIAVTAQAVIAGKRTKAQAAAFLEEMLDAEGQIGGADAS